MAGDSCQAIYGWRGAVDALSSWPTDLRLHLTESFRFGSGIATEANKWLGTLGAPYRLSGASGQSLLGPLTDPQVILCRTNAEAFAQARAALEAGRRAALAGSSAATLKGLAQAALDLQAAGRTGHHQLAAFRSWGQVRDYARTDTAGADLAAFVRLIDSSGPAMVLGVIDALAREDTAEVVACTVHTAKGREWERVRIGGDFPEPASGRAVPRGEAMLAYVAVTRARCALDHIGIAWIDHHPVSAPRKEIAMTNSSPDPLASAEGPRPYAGGRAQAESGSRIIATDYAAWTAVSGALPGDHPAIAQLGQQWRAIMQRGLDHPGAAAGRYRLLAHAAEAVTADPAVAERPSEATVLGRLAGHAKLHSGRLLATAEQQFARSEKAGPYDSRGHAESGARIVASDYMKWACTSAAGQITTAEHPLQPHAQRLANAWDAIRQHGLADGPDPAAARYGELADAACAVADGFTPELPCFALHLVTELAAHASKHAVRLHATAGARIQRAASPEDRQAEVLAGQFEIPAPAGIASSAANLRGESARQSATRNGVGSRPSGVRRSNRDRSERGRLPSPAAAGQL